jgi:biotin transport system substrate-specific component
MFRRYIRFTGKPTTDDVLLSLLGALLLCLLAPHRILASTEVPVTLQSLLVVLIPALTGMRTGVFAVLLYLLAGILGVPVFAEFQSGFVRFLGPTGGFLMSFAISAWIAGMLSEQLRVHQRLKLLGVLSLSHAVVLIMGLFWYWGMIPEDEPWLRLKNEFIPNTIVKIGLSFIALQVIGRLLAGKEEFYGGN